MGFIGGGAILRRDDIVIGVTTAATMWYLTVLGLCFGGGQIGLGSAGLGVGLVVLAGLTMAEDRMRRDQMGKLLVATSVSGPDESEIRAILEAGGFRILWSGLSAAHGDETNELIFEVRWRARASDTRLPDWLRQLRQREGVLRLVWTPKAF